jgi:hypothetical protein
MVCVAPFLSGEPPLLKAAALSVILKLGEQTALLWAE